MEDHAGGATVVGLLDGTSAVLRPVTAEDQDALLRLHESVGDDNLRLRFFSCSRTAGAAYVRHVLHTPERLALVVERDAVVVALGTAEVLDAETAEVALLVSDDCHDLGIGTLLLGHLAAVARDRGIRRFVALVLADNVAMLRVMRDAGFAGARRGEAGCVHVEVDTAEVAAALAGGHGDDVAADGPSQARMRSAATSAA